MQELDRSESEKEYFMVFLKTLFGESWDGCIPESNTPLRAATGLRDSGGTALSGARGGRYAIWIFV
jgi:hypothetical protein